MDLKICKNCQFYEVDYFDFNGDEYPLKHGKCRVYPSESPMVDEDHTCEYQTPMESDS